MKKLMETLAFALVAIAAAHAAETTIVDYGQTSETTVFNLVWEYETRSSGGVTYAVITGVRDSGSAYISGSISVPTSVSETPNGTGYIVKEIADGAFANQIGITSVSIPLTVAKIGTGVFTGCSVLSEITVDGNNPWLASLDGALYDKDFTTIFACPALTETIVLPTSLETISSEAFAGAHRIVSLDVPETVVSIGARAFKDCTRLESISFKGNAPASDSSIIQGANANLIFYKKSNSTGWSTPPWSGFNLLDSESDQASGIISTSFGQVIWRYRVRQGEAEIYNNGSAAVPTSTTQTYSYDEENNTWVGNGKLIVPSSLDGYPVTGIGDGAFAKCAALTEVELPSTIKHIGKRPFSESAIITLALPDSLRVLDGNPLSGCDTILSVTISPDNSYFAIVDGILYDKDIRLLIGCPARKETASIASTVTSIGDEAFYGCFRLREISLPIALSEIGDQAFRGAVRLTSLELPVSMVEIGQAAFADCTSLIAMTYCGDAPNAADDIYEGTPETLTSSAFENAKGFTSGTWKGRPIELMPNATPKSGSYLDNNGISWSYVIENGKAVVQSVSATGDNLTVSIPKEINGLELGGIKSDALDGVSGVLTYRSESGLYKAKNGCLYSADGKTLIRVPDSLVLPYSVTTEVSSMIVTVTIVPGLKDSGNPGNDGTSITTNITSSSTSHSKEKVDGDISFDALLSGVTTIADHAFYGCNSNLTNDYTSTSENLSGETGFIGTSGDAYVRTSTKVTSTNSTYETTFTLPATVKTVGANAFEGSGVVSSRNTTPQTPTDSSSRRQELTDTRQLEESSRYIGWIEQSGKIVGTVAVKTGKARNGVIKTSGSVVKIGAKKTMIKSMSELSAIDGLTLVKDLSASKSDATAFNAFKGKCWTVALMTSNSNAALLDGYTTLSIAIQAKGKVRIAGTAADGTKISASAQMVVDGDTFKIPVAAQLYSGKRGGFATVFTVTEEGEISVDGTSVAFTAILNGAPVHISLLTIDSAPRGNALSGDISIWGAGNDEYSLAENLGWKPRYTKSSGQFKGKLYLIRNSDMKRVRATVTGVVANEIGYGTAVVKGVRSLKVEVK